MPAITIENVDLLCKDFDEVALGVIVQLHALRQAAIRAMPATMRISPHGLVRVTSVEPPYMTVQVQESKDKKTVKIPKNKVPK